MFSIIVALGKNNEIGCNNKLMWSVPEDLRNFKKLTTGKKIIMGRKTFESIGRKLPDRENIIISRSLDSKYAEDKGVIVYNSLKELLKEYENKDEEIFVIGGGEIYEIFLKMCTRLYVSYIDYENLNADTYFPNFNKNDWNKIEEKDYDNWKFIIYEKH